LSFPLSDIVGPRRPLGIGISVSEFERDYLRQPPENELSRYSTNPRNRMGDWYEDQITARLEEFCPRRGWQWTRKVNLGRSRIHLTDKVVDILVNEQLGLELKYLKGGGSLIRPKALVDALDFTNRRVNCLYVIDGPGWLPEVGYLAHWWEFTCANHLEQTISRFMNLRGR
jgi:hypothetical protein